MFLVIHVVSGENKGSMDEVYLSSPRCLIPFIAGYPSGPVCAHGRELRSAGIDVGLLAIFFIFICIRNVLYGLLCGGVLYLLGVRSCFLRSSLVAGRMLVAVLVQGVLFNNSHVMVECGFLCLRRDGQSLYVSNGGGIAFTWSNRDYTASS